MRHRKGPGSSRATMIKKGGPGKGGTKRTVKSKNDTKVKDRDDYPTNESGW